MIAFLNRIGFFLVSICTRKRSRKCNPVRVLVKCRRRQRRVWRSLLDFRCLHVSEEQLTASPCRLYVTFLATLGPGGSNVETYCVVTMGRVIFETLLRSNDFGSH